MFFCVQFFDASFAERFGGVLKLLGLLVLLILVPRCSSICSQQTTADSRPEETIGCGQPQLKCVGPTGPMIGLGEGFI